MTQPVDDTFVASEEAFRAFVEAWERGTLPRAQWSHAAHVGIGACYTVRYGESALAKIREGILRYNDAVGTANTESSGYHETLTRLWAGVVAEAVAGFSNEWLAAPCGPAIRRGPGFAAPLLQLRCRTKRRGTPDLGGARPRGLTPQFT